MDYKMTGRDLFPGYALRGEARGVRERFADNPDLGNSPPSLALFEREGRLLCRITCPASSVSHALHAASVMAPILAADAVCLVLDCCMRHIKPGELTPEMLRPGHMQKQVESGNRGDIISLMLALRITDDQPPKTRTAAYPYVREEGPPATIRWLSDHPVSDLPSDQLVVAGVYQQMAEVMRESAYLQSKTVKTGQTVTGRSLGYEEVKFYGSMALARWLEFHRYQVEILAPAPPDYEPDYADVASLSRVAELSQNALTAGLTGQALRDFIFATLSPHHAEVESRVAAYGVPPERMRLEVHMDRLVERVEAVGQAVKKMVQGRTD